MYYETRASPVGCATLAEEERLAKLMFVTGGQPALTVTLDAADALTEGIEKSSRTMKVVDLYTFRLLLFCMFLCRITSAKGCKASDWSIWSLRPDFLRIVNVLEEAKRKLSSNSSSFPPGDNVDVDGNAATAIANAARRVGLRTIRLPCAWRLITTYHGNSNMTTEDVLKNNGVHKELCKIMMKHTVFVTPSYLQEDEKFLQYLHVPIPRRQEKTRPIQLRCAKGGEQLVKATFQVAYKPPGVFWRIFERCFLGQTTL